MTHHIPRSTALAAIAAYRAAGAALSKKVVLGRLLGSGSFADVYAVGKRRVVKIIDTAAGGAAEVALREQMAEAETAAMEALNGSPCIMPLLDSFVYETAGRRLHLLFMPRLESLTDYLCRTKEPLDCLALMEDLALALSACAGVFGGIVHCDICLSNIYVDRNRRFLLSDFGVAALPYAANIYGHTGFNPASDAVVTVQSDIYSIGAVIVASATGCEPLRDPQGDVVIPPELPDAAARIAKKCLSLRAEDRYGSGAELLAAVRAARRCVSGRGGTVRVNTALLQAKELYAAGRIEDALRILELAEPDASLLPARTLFSYLKDRSSTLPSAYHEEDEKLLFVVGWIECAEAARNRAPSAAGLDLLRRSASLGFAPAMYYVGHALYYGQHVPRDSAEGLRYLHSAAERGFYDALRVLYREGALTRKEEEMLRALTSSRMPAESRRRSLAAFL